MRNLLLMTTAFALTLAASSAMAGTANFNANASSVSAISASEQAPLNFGNIISTDFGGNKFVLATDGTITQPEGTSAVHAGGHSVAEIAVTGAANAAYTISGIANTPLSGPSANAANFIDAVCADQATPAVESVDCRDGLPGSVFTLDGTGNGVVLIGGSLTWQAPADPGVYTGSVQLTVNYQ